jgi:hypothetical protein
VDDLVAALMSWWDGLDDEERGMTGAESGEPDALLSFWRSLDAEERILFGLPDEQ